MSTRGEKWSRRAPLRVPTRQNAVRSRKVMCAARASLSSERAPLEPLIQCLVEEPPGETMIAILDYGAGNLRSVARALEVAGERPLVTSDPSTIAAADGLIVPGQGSAVDAMRNLERLDLVEPVK